MVGGHSQLYRPKVGHKEGSSITMLYNEALKTVASIERKISSHQERVSVLSRELASLGRQLFAARQVVAVLEKEGSA